METENKWYCFGQHYNKDGQPCTYDDCVTFKYIPKIIIDVDASHFKRQDWMFDDKNECQNKCDMLNQHNEEVMRNAGITNFKEFIHSRAHEVDSMLTVKDLIEFLKKQDPNALVVGYEPNSYAYVSQSKDLPSVQIRTVEDDKIYEYAHLMEHYRHLSEEDRKKKIEENLNEMYRYVQDQDVIIQF